MKKVIFALLAFVLPAFFYFHILSGKTFGFECATSVIGTGAPYEQQVGDTAFCSVVSDVGAYVWQHIAWWSKGVDEYLDGEMPLWNGQSGTGVPLAANFQSNVYFLPNMLFAIPKSILSYDLYFLFRMSAAALGMYLFLRSLRLTKPVSLIGSLAVYLNGYMIHIPTIGHHNVDILIPWIAFMMKRSYDTRKLKDLIILSALLAFSHLGGMPEASIFVALLYFLFTAFFAFSDRKNNWLKTFGVYSLVFVTSLLMSAILIIPGQEYIANSENFHIPGREGSYSVPPAYSLFWPFPYALGPLNHTGAYREVLGSAAWYGNFVGTFFSLMVVTSAALVLFGRKYIKEKGFYAFYIFAVSALFILLLQYFQIIPNLISKLPFFSVTNFTKYSLSVINFLVGAVAAMTIEFLMERGVRRYLFGGVFLIAIAALVVFIVFKGEILPPDQSLFLKQLLLSSAVLFGTLFLFFIKPIFSNKKLLTAGIFLIAAGELFIYVPNLIAMKRLDSLRTPPAVDFLKTKDYTESRIFSPDHILYPNFSTYYGLNDIRNIDALWPKYYYEYLENFVATDLVSRMFRFGGALDTPDGVEADIVDNNFFDLLSVKYILSYRDMNEYEAAVKDTEVVSRPQFTKIYDKEMKIYENTRFVPRLHSVSSVICAKSDEETVDRMLEFERQIIDLAVVNSSTCRETNRFAAAKITDTLFDDKKVTFKYSAPSESYVILSNTFYPGWKAKVDGKKVDLERANFVFQGIRLPESSGSFVEIYYDPLSFKLGAGITLGTAISALIIYLARGRKMWSKGLKF